MKFLSYLIQGVDIVAGVFCLTFLPVIILLSDAPIWAKSLYLVCCLLLTAASVFHFKATGMLRE